MGRPKASTSGQYDGDGRCTCLPVGTWAMSLPSATLTSRPSSPVSYLRYHQSSRVTMVGIGSKLYSGAGEGMLHSRLRLSHGSASQVRVAVFEAFLARLRLTKML